MSTSHQTYIGSGDLWLKEVGAAAGKLKVANISKLELSFEEEVKNLRAGKGNVVVNEIRRISDVKAAVTIHSFNAKELAIALRATSSSVTGATASNETATAYKGAFIPTAKIGLSAVTVTGPGGTPTYVVNTDYEVRDSGIYIPETSTIANAATIEIDYTFATHEVVEALVNSGKEYELFFDGLNEADSGKPVVVDFYRWKPGALGSLPLFGEDFAALDLEGALLADTTKAGGTSQYFRIKMKT